MLQLLNEISQPEIVWLGRKELSPPPYKFNNTQGCVTERFLNFGGMLDRQLQLSSETIFLQIKPFSKNTQTIDRNDAVIISSPHRQKVHELGIDGTPL